MIQMLREWALQHEAIISAVLIAIVVGSTVWAYRNKHTRNNGE